MSIQADALKSQPRLADLARIFKESRARTDARQKPRGAVWAPLLSPLILIAAWTLLSQSGAFPREIVVPLDVVWRTAAELWANGELPRHLGQSLSRLFFGFGFGAVIGIALGAAMALSRQVEAFVAPTFQLTRLMPTIALIPAFILIFGVGETVKIVLVAKATALPIALATFEGVRGVQRVYFDVARVYRVGGFTRWAKVLFPAATPPVMTGLRVALSRSWMVLVGAELLVADSGLGQMMEWGRQMFRIDIVLIGVVLTGVIGFAIDKSFRLIERRLVRWQA